jgi:hypothetical protein
MNAATRKPDRPPEIVEKRTTLMVVALTSAANRRSLGGWSRLSQNAGIAATQILKNWDDALDSIFTNS